MSTLRALHQVMAPALRRVALMVGRAILELVDDGAPLQTLQVSLLADEVRANVERVQEYGFTSHPINGAEAVAVAVAGSRDHLVVIAVDDRRYRLKGLEAGEVALYTDEGDKIVLKRGGIVEVTAATKVRLVTPLVECTGDVTVAGTLTAAVDVVGGGVSLKGHRHGGVQAGGSLTGVPS